MRLEKLCRYACRPAIAAERLAEMVDGRLCHKLKRRWRDGTKKVVFEPVELLEHMAALVPAPRSNLVRYSGILAPGSAFRRNVIPGTPPERDDCACGCGGKKPATDKIATGKTIRPRRYAWAELLKRVFAVDVLQCDRCGGRMRILCAVNPPDAIRKILECLGLTKRPPPIAPALRGDESLIGEWGMNTIFCTSHPSHSPVQTLD